VRTCCLTILLFVSLWLGAKTATYTVSGTNRITPSGVEPLGAMAYFRGTKQLTQNSSSMLVLHGYANTRIESVVLSMHSNASAGAGTLLMTIGPKQVWRIQNSSFASADWNGAFTKSFSDITHDFSPVQTVTSGDSILIQLTATENSLYINSFSIHYSPVPLSPMTVSFSTNTDSLLSPLTESGTGTGVRLPHLRYADSLWRFVGWSEQEVSEVLTQPKLFCPDSLYYPCEQCTLFAVYASLSERDSFRLVQDTIFANGDYVMGSPVFYQSLAAGGVNRKGHVYSYRLSEPVYTSDSLWIYPLKFIPPECRYQIEFYADSSATIYNTYDESFLSPPDSSCNILKSTEDGRWQYRVHNNRYVTFYKDYPASKTRKFAPTFGETLATSDSVWFQLQYFTGYSPMLAFSLFNVSDCKEWGDDEPTRYTTMPYGRTALEPIQEQAYITTYIANTRHQWMQLFSLRGQLLLATESDIDLSAYPRGFYIISDDVRTYKVFVP